MKDFELSDKITCSVGFIKCFLIIYSVYLWVWRRPRGVTAKPSDSKVEGPGIYSRLSRSGYVSFLLPKLAPILRRYPFMWGPAIFLTLYMNWSSPERSEGRGYRGPRICEMCAMFLNSSDMAWPRTPKLSESDPGIWAMVLGQKRIRGRMIQESWLMIHDPLQRPITIKLSEIDQGNSVSILVNVRGRMTQDSWFITHSFILRAYKEVD